MPHAAGLLLHRLGVSALPGYFIADTPWAGVKATTGFTNRGQASTMLSGGQFYNTPALNDLFDQDQWLATGTYKIASLHQQDTTFGICTFLFNGVSQGTIDAYNAASTVNNYVEITGLAVTAGLQTIEQKIASKNASSSNYYWAPQTTAFTRTGP